MSFIENALRLLEINSVTQHGNEDLINHLIPVFERLGMKLCLQQVPHSLEDHSKRQFNLIGILGDDLVDARNRKGLLLTTHMDTADAGDPADWTALDGKPWTPKIIDGAVLGLGAARSKLDFYCKLMACERFAHQNLKQPVYLAATCGGESPLVGAKYMIQSKVVNPQYVFVGHPTGLKLQCEQKNQLSFQIRISFVAIERDAQDFNAKLYLSTGSRSGHVGLDADADHTLALPKIFELMKDLNASRIPMKLFFMEGSSSYNKIPGHARVGIVIPSNEMEEMREYFRAFVARHPQHGYELNFGGTGDRGIRLLPGEVLSALFAIDQQLRESQQKFTAAGAEGSLVSIGAIKQERDSLVLRVNFHLTREDAQPEIRKAIEQELKMSTEALSLKFHSLTVDCRRLVATPQFFQDQSSIFVKTVQADMERAGLDPRVYAGKTSSDAAYFSERGYPTIAFGPGDEAGNTQSPNEKVMIESLYAALGFYTQAIETFCVRGI